MGSTNLDLVENLKIWIKKTGEGFVVNVIYYFEIESVIVHCPYS